MHICNSTSTQNIHPQIPSTHQPTSTSFETAKQQALIQHCVEAAEKNHALQANPGAREAAELLRELAIDCEHASKLLDPLSDATPMFNRKHEDPSTLLSDVGHSEVMRTRFKSPLSCRWLAALRLQWRVLFYLIVGLVALLILYAAMNRETLSSTRVDDLREPGGRIRVAIEEDKTIGRPPPRIRIDVYMESQCPDTADFLETQLMPTWNEMKDYMNLHVIPFGKARWSKRGGDDFSFQCQHGQNECLVNQLMCCGIDRLQTVELYLPYVVCLQGTYLGDEDEAKCAQQAKIPNPEMQNCANSKKGRQLHQHMGNLTKSLSPPLYFVPWVLIDNKREPGAVMDLKSAICKKLNLIGVRPAGCDQPNRALTTLSRAQ